MTHVVVMSTEGGALVTYSSGGGILKWWGSDLWHDPRHVTSSIGEVVVVVGEAGNLWLHPSMVGP